MFRCRLTLCVNQRSQGLSGERLLDSLVTASQNLENGVGGVDRQAHIPRIAVSSRVQHLFNRNQFGRPDQADALRFVHQAKQAVFDEMIDLIMHE